MKILFILIFVFIISILYLISIKPRIYNRPDYKPFFGHLYAHRGLHNSQFPENSFSAIKHAVEMGYGVEFDVHLTKDNIPVIFHDDSLYRMCGIKGYLKDYTFEELGQFKLLGTDESIPSLESVLEMVDGKVPLIIEYKVEKNVNALCSICNKILSDYHGLYCIESFHPLAVRWYKTHRPDIVRGQLSEDFTKKKLSLTYFLLSHLIGNCYASPDFIAYNCKHKNEISRNICRKLYKCLSVGWTVRSPEEFKKIKNSFDLFIFEGFVPYS